MKTTNGILFILIVCTLVISFFIDRFLARPTSVHLAAQKVLAMCSKVDYRPSCYEKEIPKTMQYLSMEDAFSVTKEIQDRDAEYLYCHVVAHRLSYLESEKHPSQWKDILSRCPMAMCNYGCLHGSLMQRFQSDTLTDAQIDEVLPDLSDVCEPRGSFQPSEIDRTMCYHALGHLAMFITKARLPKATWICEKVGQKSDGRNYVDTCLEGVYMTVFQSIDPEDLALVKDIKPTKEGAAGFCAGQERFWPQCRRESYPLFTEELQTPEGLAAFCSYATDETMERNCYYTGMNMVATNAFSGSGGEEVIATFCRGVESRLQGTCFAGAAMRLLQLDPERYIETAVNICRKAEMLGVEKDCYESILYYATFSFFPGTHEFTSYCGRLPDSWKKQCLERKSL